MAHSIGLGRICAVLTTSALLAGCVSTVDGTAVRGRPAGPLDVPVLTESQLDGLLLSIGELNGIMGSTQMKVTSELDEMTDHADEVSDPDCLGAVYGAEEPVYAGSGWTAVRGSPSAIRERAQYDVQRFGPQPDKFKTELTGLL